MFDWYADWVWSCRAPSDGMRTLERETFTVQKGKRYRAIITLSWSESFVGNDYIAGQFKSVGFADVTVVGSGTQRTAEGRWTLADTTAEIDPHIKQITLLA